MEKTRSVRIRDPQGHPQQPDRPRGRRAPAARALAVDRHRRHAGPRPPVFGLAALRVAAPRLPPRGNAARPCDRSRDQPAPPARNRDAASAAADREARDPADGHGRPVSDRRGGDRARDAVQAGGHLARGDAVGSERGIGVAEQPFNWRPTIAKRVAVAAAVFAVWTLGIEIRLIYLQVVSHADLVARAERQQMRTVPSPAKRGEISDRHGRVLAYSVDADTIYAVPHEIERQGQDRDRVVRRARRLSRQGSRRASRAAERRSRLHLRQAARHPARSQARRRPQSRGRRLHEGEPPLLSEPGAGRARAGLRRHRQRRPRRSRSGV